MLLEITINARNFTDTDFTKIHIQEILETKQKCVNLFFLRQSHRFKYIWISLPQRYQNMVLRINLCCFAFANKKYKKAKVLRQHDPIVHGVQDPLYTLRETSETS